jgi:type IV pilus assembly protein PilM
VTFVHHVKTPRLSDGELDQALQFELQGKLPYAPQDAVIRAIVAGDVLGEGDARQEVIVVAASRQVVESYLRMAHRATLDVVALNVEPCALAECFGRLFRRADDASRTILFIDIGASTTQVVLTHGSRLVFARNLLKGGDRLDEAVAKSLNITPDQARELRRRYSADDCPDPAAGEELYRLLGRPLQEMADELAQCLNYYESVFRGRSVERAIFVGGSAHDKRLCQSLAQRLNLPAQVGDPLMRVRRLDRNCVAADEKVPQPDWAVAVGLSLGAAGL